VFPVVGSVVVVVLVDVVEVAVVVLVVVVLLVDVLVDVLDVLSVLDVVVVSCGLPCCSGPPEIAHADPPESTAAAATPATSRSARSFPTIMCPFAPRIARRLCQTCNGTSTPRRDSVVTDVTTLRDGAHRPEPGAPMNSRFSWSRTR
jgi:hypothetical protein